MSVNNGADNGRGYKLSWRRRTINDVVAGVQYMTMLHKQLHGRKYAAKRTAISVSRGIKRFAHYVLRHR